MRILNALASGDAANTDRYNFLSNELSTSTYTVIQVSRLVTEGKRFEFACYSAVPNSLRIRLE